MTDEPAGQLRPLGRYLATLLAIEALFVILHLAVPGWALVDLDQEHNLPTWFSGVQLAAIAAAAMATFHREGGSLARRALWCVVALAFLYLSFDEMSVVHEGVLREETLAALDGASLLRGVPPWQLVFAPAAVGAAVLFGYLLAARLAGAWPSEPAMLGGLALWGLALALEGAAMTVFIPRHWYRLEVALEELCEMAGATLLLGAVVAHAIAPRSAPSGAGALRRRLLAAAPLVLLVVVPAATVAVVTGVAPGEVQRAAGERLLADGMYGDATEAFTAALAAHPDDIEALRGLGTAAYRAGDLATAEHAFERALTLAPGDETVRNALDLLRVKRQRTPAGARAAD